MVPNAMRLFAGAARCGGFPIALLAQSLPPGGRRGICFACHACRTGAANAEAISLFALYVSREISYDISPVKPVAAKRPERAGLKSAGGVQQEGLMLKRLAAAAMAAACAMTTAAQAQQQDVKFVLDFISLGRHAPWYVALGKGYFKEEGLNVTILPSKGTADAIRSVATGTTELGFIDVPSLVAAGSAASAVKIVAANYQKPPYCIFSLNPGANIDTAKKLTNLELGSSSASFVPKIWAAIMEMNGVDSKTMKIVNIDPAARVPMLATKKVASIDLFIMSEPAIRRAVPDGKPVCLFAGDLGLEIYANSIGVNEEFLKKNPEAVKKFVRAALRGWKDTFANPQEAAQIQLQHVKALDPQIIVEEIDILRRVALTPEVQRDGLGLITMARMKNTVDFINKNIEVPGEKLTAEQIYVPGFLPEKPILP
jgi:NitT/TauT family transport system substrate-binding protein